MQKKNLFSISITVLLFIGLLVYGNYQLALTQPGGTDFLYRWLPTRLVLFDGYDNPYSPEVEYQVELVHHGHAHTEDETPGIFAYPYYIMGIIFPFAFIGKFALARATFMTLLELANILIVLVTLKILKLQPANWMIAALLLFSLFSSDFSQGLIDGNPASLAALFAFLSLYALLRKSDSAAGILLALSTIKPQLVVLFVILVILWAFFQKRYKIIFSSAITMAVLLGGSFVMQPSWLAEFIKDITTYPGVASPSTPLAILSFWMNPETARAIAVLSTILSILILFGVWVQSFKNGFTGLLWAACITFTLMPFTGITSAKSNFIAMLPGIILLLDAGIDWFKAKSLMPGIFLLLWILFSWVYFLAGRNWTVNGTLIYFVDFYPMPLLLLVLYSTYYPYKKLAHDPLIPSA